MRRTLPDGDVGAACGGECVIEDVRLVALEQSHHAARPVEHARVGRLPHGHIKWVDETPGGVADSERALVQQPLCTSVGSSGPI